MVQHADDTSIFITNNQEFDVLDNVLKIYSEGSGSRINKQKSQGLWVGRWKNRVDKPGNSHGTKTKLKFWASILEMGIPLLLIGNQELIK